MMRLAGFQIAFLSIVMTASCAREPRFTVVMVDTSLTVRNFDPYKKAYDKVVNALAPGDRLVMVLVKGRVLNAPQPKNALVKINRGHAKASISGPYRNELRDETELLQIVDEELHVCNKITEALLECEEKIDQAKKVLSGALDQALGMPRSDHTALLATVDEVAKYFKTAPQSERVLIFLSDMLEDSPQARFELKDPTKEFTKHYIAGRRNENNLPDLKGARVFVAGAEAKSEKKRNSVMDFWVNYLSIAGAKIDTSNYSYQLIGFD